MTTTHVIIFLAWSAAVFVAGLLVGRHNPKYADKAAAAAARALDLVNRKK